MTEFVPQPRSKQREPLDAALLCSKLESHLREQDAARLRKEKRDAVRNGHYVPKVAAKAFAATSTPMNDIANVSRASRRPSDQRPHTVDESRGLAGKAHVPSIHQYAALNFHWPSYDLVSPSRNAKPALAMFERPEADVAPDEMAFAPGDSATARGITARHDDITATKRPSTDSEKRPSIRSEKRNSLELERRRQSIKVERRESTKEEAKHDSMNPTSSGGIPLFASQEASPSRRQRQSVRVSPDKFSTATVAAPDRGRGQYRPGDAAKRRSIDGQRLADTLHTHSERRPSKFIENDALFDDSIPEDQATRPQRPKLVPHDRPNWAQQSQTGDDMHLSLRFFSRTSKKKGGEGNGNTNPPRPHSVMENRNIVAPVSDCGRTSRQCSLPEEGHLIADAVKIIKREEKNERRKSVFGLFKRS